MRNRTKRLVLLCVVLLGAVPTTAHLDATARAMGNRKDVAVSIGERVFQTSWPVQVLNVEANGVDSTVVAGLRLSGVHFHRELTQEQFDAEIETLVAQAFAAAPAVEEIDVWASVPLSTPKGAVVAGDMAMPTWRTVFTVSTRRSEAAGALAERLHNGKDVFYDEDWTRSAFKKSG